MLLSSLDEAKNATNLKLKCSSPGRLSAKAIITGDVNTGGFAEEPEKRSEKTVQKILQNIDGIAHIELDERCGFANRLCKSDSESI